MQFSDLNRTNFDLKLNFSIGYHNIEGLHHAILGCKLQSCVTFLNDIEILSETWTECQTCSNIVEVENYVLIQNIQPIKHGKKKGRKSGGIKIFVKSNLCRFVKSLKKTDNYAWLELDKNIFENFDKNPLICAIYSQPIDSKYYSGETWSDLETDILYMTSNNTPFCIIGDMNGRVGQELEFLSNTKEAEEINTIPSRKIKPTTRKNCDLEQPGKVGKKIIQLCKSYDMQIGNGRLKGDCFGNLTHFNKNKGASTVDLALISDIIYEDIDDLKILPQETYSDHCKMVLTIKNMKQWDEEPQDKDYNWTQIKPSFRWGPNSPGKYKSALEEAEIQPDIEDCMNKTKAVM